MDDPNTAVSKLEAEAENVLATLKASSGTLLDEIKSRIDAVIGKLQAAIEP
jgi:ElaB/YqjD/DUF883 family membrane-anchored ribosome-binding protein